MKLVTGRLVQIIRSGCFDVGRMHFNFCRSMDAVRGRVQAFNDTSYDGPGKFSGGRDLLGILGLLGRHLVAYVQRIGPSRSPP
jgi:hypothetical protein